MALRGKALVSLISVGRIAILPRGGAHDYPYPLMAIFSRRYLVAAVHATTYVRPLNELTVDSHCLWG
jgi:hypothetical protein